MNPLFRVKTALCSVLLATGFLALPYIGQAAPTKTPAAAADPYQTAIKQLSDKDPQIRRMGAEALGRLRNPAAQDALKRLLKDQVPVVRATAADSLGLLRSVAVSSEIARMLESDPEPTVRQAAAISLGYIADPKTIPALIKGIKDMNDATRFACINSLGIMRNDAAVEALAQQLKNTDPRIRSSVAYALGNIRSPQAVAPLSSAVKVSLTTSPAENEKHLVDPDAGASAIRSLGLIGDPSVIPSIKPYLTHKEKKVRIYTGQALHRLGDASGLDAVREGASDADGSLRRIAAEVLGDAGADKDIGLVRRLAADPDGSVKQAAETALKKMELRQDANKKAAPASKSKKTKN